MDITFAFDTTLNLEMIRAVQVLIGRSKEGGTVGPDVTLASKLVCLYPLPHYGHGCWISTLIMVAINFLRNSDLFKKKNIFLSQKLTTLEHFKENLSKFSKKISEIQNENL